MSNPVAPYYQRYDSKKNYVQQLAVPGRVAQASEWNDMGAMNLDFMKRLGDAIYSNGNIIDGCDIAINGTQVTITEGKIYLDGLVREVPETSLIIEGIGEENICPFIEETIVTEANDTSLYDPAAGAENYGQPGVHMRKQTVKFGINIEGAPVLYKLIGGTVFMAAEGTNEYAAITEILARRTYDESGNYRVSGLRMKEKGIEDDDNIHITLTAGKCYVLGYEVVKPTDSTFLVPKAKTVREVSGESYIHNSSYNPNKIYRLSNHPVSEIYQMSVVVQITERVTRGSIRGGLDYLPHAPVFEIDKVQQGGVEFTRGADWQRSGDTIDWSLLGNEPEIGSSYDVTYRYTYTLSPSEYELTVDTSVGESSIAITNPDITPYNDSVVLINYGFYLARADLISISKDGEIVITQGEPDVMRNIRVPVITDDTILSIGSITIPANSSKVTVVNLSIENSTMNDIQKTVKRVDDLEYNQAVSDLDEEAMEGEPATELRGILTDGFIGFSKCDLEYHKTGSDGKEEVFDASIDIDAEELILPFTEKFTDITINNGNYDTIIGEMGVVVTSPYTEEQAFYQPYATRAMLVNPYSVFDPVVPVTLTPNVDNWIDYNQVTVEEDGGTTVRSASAGTLRSWWNNSASQYFDNLNNVVVSNNTGTRATYTGTKQSTKQTVMESVVTYMRQREIILKSAGFPAFADNIYATFDDRTINLSAIAPCVAGTREGTVKADANGNVNCRFTVPANVPCGTKSVKLFYEGDGINYAKQGEATYTANGRLHTTTTTIFHSTTIVNVVDPVAQTFQFSEEKYLTSVDLYFAAKDEITPIVIQIRNVVNGYPGAECFGEVTISASDVSVSSDASAKTVAKFGNAIKCNADTQYCVVVMSDSPLPAVWVARLGEEDIQTEKTVTSNPYTAGVLFSSSNALTWTAHQDMDMKVGINTAKFNGRGSIIFNDVPVSAADSLVLAVDAVVPSTTSLKWYYKLPGGAWILFDIYDLVKLTTVASTLSVKCEFTAVATRAPMISTMCMSMATFMNKSTGTYITREVTLTEKFNNLKVYANVAKPQGSDATFYYSVNDGVTWIELPNDEATHTTVDEEFIQYYWNKSLGAEYESFRLKIALSTSNPINSPRVKKLMCIMKNV